MFNRNLYILVPILFSNSMTNVAALAVFNTL